MSKHRPEGSNWGDFGANDQVGRINLLDSDAVRRGLAEAREGIVFSLSLPLDLPGGETFSPGRRPPRFRPTDRKGAPFFCYPMSREKPGAPDVVNDDEATLTLQYSTHWDALCHIGYCGRRWGAARPDEVHFYNGFRAGADIDAPDAAGNSRVRALGIEAMAERGVQGRGVLLDLHAHYGEAWQPVGYDALMRIAEADRLTVEPGDILLVHTGMGRMIVDMKGKPDAARLRSSFAALDGRDERLLQWITETGVAAIAADNHAVEFVPARASDEADAPVFPLHEHCLFKLGIHLGEFWYLTELADWLRRHGRNRFLLTAPPLRLPGAVGAPVNPIATV